MKIRIIGGSISGKTYLARRLAQEYDAGMLAHRHDPFLHGADLVCLAGALERAVVHHDAVLTVEFCALGKVADVAADAVEAVDHDGGKSNLLGILHHFLELRALQIAAGKVLVDQHVFRRFLAKVHGDVLAAPRMIH